MTVLVTGGAGYIGSHVVRLLTQRAHHVVVLDDLSDGSADRVPAGVPLVVCDLLDDQAVARLFARHRFEAVMHLAAKKSVSESVREPLTYYRNNLQGLQNLLEGATASGVRRFVLSSSAAVYGTARPLVDGRPRDSNALVGESVVPAPVNPYGRTKLTAEWMLRDAAAGSGLSWTALRYFNVAGSALPSLADIDGVNLVPSLLRAQARGERPVVFGTDFPTADGSCVRDFVHVEDVAEAHLAVLANRTAVGAGEVYNVGSGVGTSVLEMLRLVGEVTRRQPQPLLLPRRPGDPPHVVADVTAIRERLGWTALRTIRDMVESAWDAERVEGASRWQLVPHGAA